MRWPRSRKKRCSLARRAARAQREKSAWVRHAAGGYYYPGKDLSIACGGNARLSRSRVQCREMKIGGARISEDREAHRACLRKSAVRRNSPRRPRPVRYGERETMQKCCANIRCFWYEGPAILDFQLQAALAEFYPGQMANGENFSHRMRELIRHGGCGPRPRLAAVRLLRLSMAMRVVISAPWGVLLQPSGWSPSRCIPPMADIRCPEYCPPVRARRQ